MLIPDDLRYSNEHEWVRPEADGRVRIGITDYAQDALGDVVYVDLPTVGDDVAVGQSFGEVESTKSVSDIYAPVSGQVVEVNTDLLDAPDKLNSDPYGEGWIVVIALNSANSLEDANLMDAAAYIELTGA